MGPKVDNIFLDNDVLQFTLQNVNVTIANTIRRVILSDIETCVFRTYPHDKCDATFEVNTTRLNNEILKQRLSCIPIHIDDDEFPIDNFVLVIDKENTSNMVDYVTTEDFKLYDKITNNYMPQKDVEKIFPKNTISSQYIDLVRLRPKISSEIPGERLKLTCKISKSCARNDSMFNVACNSSYGFTPDKNKIDIEWKKKEEELKKDEKLTSDDIDYLKRDWYTLDAKRIFIPNSFDFTIQTVGPFSAYQLVKRSCKFIYDDIIDFKANISEVPINMSDTTIENSFDIILHNKDHSFGKCLEYLLYTKYYEGDETLSYCGFQKKHPHDEYSIIRLGYKNIVEKDTVIKNMSEACDEGEQLFKEIEQLFIE
uniref:DNA-directed RNA polymerase RpoA/D/Rpb3-type domain-containing protein n=1 Tax=viral metagenome TaxID=1070528 RepID=A0A6C0LJ55_9ZZZZ|tara:strand:+ start:1906 stop:3012 length:1107 start_codon:yes stop_codon:yes gene_type:complete